MTLIDGLDPPGQIMQILPNAASSAAQILMQSAFSCALIGELPVSGVLHTIHRPLSSIDGKRIQIAILYMAKAAKPCTTASEQGQGKGIEGRRPISEALIGGFRDRPPSLNSGKFEIRILLGYTARDFRKQNLGRKMTCVFGTSPSSRYWRFCRRGRCLRRRTRLST